jgi:hypothetical protein
MEEERICISSSTQDKRLFKKIRMKKWIHELCKSYPCIDLATAFGDKSSIFSNLSAKTAVAIFRVNVKRMEVYGGHY